MGFNTEALVGDEKVVFVESGPKEKFLEEADCCGCVVNGVGLFCGIMRFGSEGSKMRLLNGTFEA